MLIIFGEIDVLDRIPDDVLRVFAEEGREIEAVILDGRLIYLGSVDMISPWEYDKCREEYREAFGSYESFDRRNYAL